MIDIFSISTGNKQLQALSSEKADRKHCQYRNIAPYIVTAKPISTVKINFPWWDTGIDKEQYTNQGFSVQEVPLGK